MVTIIVTWLDGMQETYTPAGYHVDMNGLLYLHRREPGLDNAQPKRCIPLVNVRIWQVEGER